MEECNEVTNQNEGSSESETGDYFELILQNLDADHEGSSGSRSSPPILPRKSPKSHCSLGIRTTGKPRALPPPASSAIENDSILSNCDHSNQTATPPPLPAKTYDKRNSSRSCQLVDKAIQCSSKDEIVQDVEGSASLSMLTEDGDERRVVRADGLLVVSTSANIILTQSNSVRTIVLTPTEPISTVSAPRMIVLRSKNQEEEESSEERTRNEGTVLRSPGTSSRLVLESLAPSLSRSQSRGCANEYVGDPVACKKPLSKKHTKKFERGPLQGDESGRKGRGLVCQKCWKCKCNQCKIKRGPEKDSGLKAPRRDCSEREEGRKESTKELLVSLGDDGKMATGGLAEERTEEAEISAPVRRSAFLLRCFSVICCCSWKRRHDCCTWARPSDGCRCAVEEDDGGTTEGDDDVFPTTDS